MSTEQYLKDFELKLRCKYSSEATAKNYLSCVKSFFRFAQGKHGIDLNELVTQYLVWGVKSKEPKTINLHRSAVVCFFKLVKGIEIKTSDVPRKKEHKKYPKVIQQEVIAEAIRKTINIKHRLEPFSIMSWLGHSSIKTTQIYISLSRSQLSQSTDLLNGNYTTRKVS